MLIDGIPFSSGNTTFSGISRDAVASFVRFIEKRLGVVVLYDRRDIPWGRVDLVQQSAFAQKLLQSGVISSIYPAPRNADEPPCKAWIARIASRKPEATYSGGASWTRDDSALMATLAEALERHIWKETDDYFRNTLRASVRQMHERGLFHIPPSRFVGYSEKQRAEDKSLQITDDTPFLWTEGYSLVSEKAMYVPAQTVGAFHTMTDGKKEPPIRRMISNGLATWTTQTGARLAGALEVIERDAYMIMWLNQLTLPRLNLALLTKQYPSIRKIVETLTRYRLKMHVIQLATDAPAHAICVALEDISGHAPRFTFGLRVDRSLPKAIEKASLEAVRIQSNTRRNLLVKGPWDGNIQKKDIGHFDRLLYWATGDNAKKLEFLVRGEERGAVPQAWENDTEEEHLARVIHWCRENGYECISVPLTHSKRNPTSLHIEMVIMPELQPTHLFENHLVRGGTRWKTVPEKYGLTPRDEMFSDEPHPFA